MNILLIGSGGREHAILKSIKKSTQKTNVIYFGTHNNPGIIDLSNLYLCDITNNNEIEELLNIKCKDIKFTFAIIGPEGDFSENERNQILKFEGVKPIKINENILRAETATISIISIINYILNL